MEDTARLRMASPYSAVITREQFLFNETRITAKLLRDGYSEDDARNKIVAENLYQYPTEKSLERMSHVCLRRLHALHNSDLIRAVVELPAEEAKQVCLYAMMKEYRLVWDFMITVIGEKYRSHDLHFTRLDMNLFMAGLAGQDAGVASWSESTTAKLKQILRKLLVDNGYLDSRKSEILRPVSLGKRLQKGIKANGDEICYPAFNYWE